MRTFTHGCRRTLFSSISQRRLPDSRTNGYYKKIQTLNIHQSLGNWIREFLSIRTQSVLVSNVSSHNNLVKSGVPQGSVLGPLLFFIYVNNLPNSICSKIRHFAEDCTIYRRIVSTDDSLTLQRDLDSLSSWCGKWQMNINISKTKFLLFLRKNDYYQQLRNKRL